MANGRWNPDLHPRGRDGEFIELLGLVKLVGVSGRDGSGRRIDLTGRRGRVEEIVPDRSTPGRPNIRVRLDGADGAPGELVNVKADRLASANPAKARIRDRFEVPNPSIDRGFSRPGPQIDRTFFDEPPRRPVDLLEPLRRGQMPRGEWARLRQRAHEESTRVGQLSDTELAGELPSAGPLAHQAIVDEQQDRARRLVDEAARRAPVIANVNAIAATLSTTDVDERAKVLDQLLSRLRFSIIDTDQTYSSNGRWTPERAAQHEAMWEDVLAQVEVAGIPQERDGFVLGGLPGAGKTTSLGPGGPAEHFGVVSWEPGQPVPEGVTHLSVSADLIKEMMIDRGMLPEGISADLKPLEQVTFIHAESNYLYKLWLKRFGDLGYNVVLDNMMDSESATLSRMSPLSRQGYQFRALFVDVPIEESKASMAARYRRGALTPRGGRFLPSVLLANRASAKGNKSKNRDAMDGLVARDYFTDWMVIDNTGVSNRTPLGAVVAEGTGTGSGADYWTGDLTQPMTAPATVGSLLPTRRVDIIEEWRRRGER